MKEEWRAIEGFENLYKVSNFGRVFSWRSCRFLKQWVTNKGYLQVALCKDGIETRCSVHRLVARAFVSNTANKPEVNHKNGIKTKNRLSNLEWVTHQENAQHAVENGLIPRKVAA